MDELRWILLVVGLLILAAIYFFADPSQRPVGKSRLDQDPKKFGPYDRDRGGNSDLSEQQMEHELHRLGALISEDRQLDSAAARREPTLSAEPDKIVSLYLRPRDEGKINGADILEATKNAGLIFGEMQIFHRMYEQQNSKSAIFSLADMMTPGSFDLDKISHLSTPGLCLFLTLPNQLSALDAWDAMQAAGKRLADLLDAELLDDSRSSLSRQRIAHIRDQMREYDRQAATGRSTPADG